MKDSQKSFLIGVVAILITVLLSVYGTKANYDSAKKIEAENSELQARLTYLQSKEAHRAEYEAGIETYKEKFNAIMSAFAPDLNQEVSIMFVDGLREDYDYDVDTFELGEPQEFYTLGSGNVDEAVLGGTTTETTTEAATTEAATTEATTDSLADATETTSTDSDYKCYRADFPITYTGSYDAIKNIVNYVDNYAQRMVINSVDIAYDQENDLYTGSMNLVCYSIEGPDRAQSQMELNDVETGVENIFLGGSGSSDSESAKLTKYDSNEGADIVSNYDFYTMLNPSGSDVSAKIVGQNGNDKDKSIISNSDNTISTVNYDFYEENGKNYCKYTLDNATEYVAEITSAEDIKLLLSSKARKDAEDKVGIRVTIRNTTTLPVYVKVYDDDAVSPRVNITSKSGAVKVY